MFTRALAVVVVAASWGMMAFSFASLAILSANVPDRPSPADVLLFSASFLAFPTVGLIVTWKRPRHPIGWLLLVIGLSLTTAVFSSEYPAVARYGGVPLPAVEWVALLGWMWSPTAGVALPLVLLLFPDGRLPGRRWRPVVTAGVVVTLALGVVAMLAPDPDGGSSGLPNPIRVDGPIGEFAEQAADAGLVMLLVMSVLGVVGMVVKFRASHGTERQQFKWLLYPATLFLAGLVLSVFNEGFAGAWLLSLGGIAGLAVGIGIAILRHRLFDIDVVIRRTLVYAVVVAILGVVYASLVLGLQAVLTQLTGLTGNDTLPVALSTLVIAALFGPVRGRVRAAVDRRFFRSRYDAQRTIEQLAGRLRGQVELDAVGRTLVDVAGQAVRPASAGLWLRTGAGRS